MIKRLLFLIVLCLGVVKLSAQISGVVTDSETGDPIPYLNVYYDGKGVGTITDIDGKYFCCRWAAKIKYNLFFYEK
jgi:hypothetical protein